ncbi:ThiF family adenylyltransferase [Nonomuraea sp. CA-141351]|uniref:ThiF family adenylyltransferase n=1 Tax=Nonomuraea sp. CA-141351 TaxID=3239996 RepID=UPI003D8AF4E4
MSPRPASPSPDLAQLEQEGYDIEIRDALLMVHHVPYVDSKRRVRYGVLVTPLELNGDLTAPPRDHTVRFGGAEPCDQTGRPLEEIINQRITEHPAEGVETSYSFSRKPQSGAYRDYHEKMTTYAALLTTHARALDPEATATPFQGGEAQMESSAFNYPDTASSRAGINLITKRLEGHRIAIVGLGGTGSYILDTVAKTPVQEIHLYDGDTFQSHNAFRAPGAPSRKYLRSAPTKVAHWASIYSNMHPGIVEHDVPVDESNVHELRDMDFVFIAIDKGSPKRLLFEKLEEYNVPFIDVGMGVITVEGQLSGLLRVTTSTADRRDHVRQRITLADEGKDEYETNIQIAELNMHNASLAVIRWKKHCGFYLDLEREHSTVYEIDGNVLHNEDTV